jgi:putative oxidoreductase
MFQRIVNTNDDFALAIVRLVLGVVFFAHGAQKMLGWFGGYGFSATMDFFTHQMGIPTVFAFLTICTEFFGGLGLIVGFLSRIAAFGIACEMIVAVAIVHRHNGFFMNWGSNQKGEGFEYHLLAIAIALAIVIKGAGALSADHVLSEERP